MVFSTRGGKGSRPEAKENAMIQTTYTPGTDEWRYHCCPIRIITDAYGNSGPNEFDSLAQAKALIADCICDGQSLLPEGGLVEHQDFEYMTMLMQTDTGSVASREEWENDYRTMSEEEWGGPDFEDGHLVEVEPDGSGWWREV